ncbi:MAG: endonuclease/exonuclease/phosphatase family protein [Candidatus Manganitrophus sp.]|nr:MAG: endonuclease/exonuclease/phosphatase family protein [Candidatus Manganitrophus sp.]
MKAFFILIGSFTLLATLLPFLRTEVWWIRIFDFPRLQITLLAVAVLILYPLVWKSGSVWEALFIVLLAASTLYQIGRMLPYTPLWKKQVRESRRPSKESSLGLLVANVWMPNKNAPRLFEIIRKADPDLILILEANHWWQSELDHLEKSHPSLVHHPLENTYGMLLYSRLELVRPEVRFLVQEDVPSIHTGVRLPSGREITLHFLHPRPPAPTEHPRSTERDVELLISGKEVRGSDKPVIVAGDLNDVAWSRTTRLFRKISGLLDPRIGRKFLNTFHAKYPFMRWPLDHVFHSPHFRLIELKRLPYFGSDHFPIFAALNLEPEAADEQEKPQPGPGDRKEAEEKIGKVKRN